MSRVTITKRFELDAGHRVLGHGGKCRFLHGHRYAFDICLSAPVLDGLGMVLDFSEVKARIGTWLDEHWDHALILNIADPLLEVLKNDEWKSAYANALRLDGTAPEGGKHRVFAMLVNPTAENLAAALLSTLPGLLSGLDGVTPVSVVCWETPTSRAEARPDAPPRTLAPCTCTPEVPSPSCPIHGGLGGSSLVGEGMTVLGMEGGQGAPPEGPGNPPAGSVGNRNASLPSHDGGEGGVRLS